MLVAEATLKELVEAEVRTRQTTLFDLAYEGDISWSTFHTVMNSGITKGTRFETIEKFARILGKRPSELIRIVAE